MDSLPPEVLVRIFGQLGLYDWKAVAWICRYFRAVLFMHVPRPSDPRPQIPRKRKFTELPNFKGPERCYICSNRVEFAVHEQRRRQLLVCFRCKLAYYNQILRISK